MATNHFAALFPAVCAGFGLFLVGVVNLVLAAQGFKVRATATLLALAMTLGAAAALDQPATLEGTAWGLALGLAPCLALGSRHLVRSASVLVIATRLPAVRFTLLAASGIGIGITSLGISDRVAEFEANASLVAEPPPAAVPVENARAMTDQGTQFQLLRAATLRDAAAAAESEERLLRDTYRAQLIRRGAADDRANCHGWVFTAGRFWVKGEDVELILKENAYRETSEPRPGDLVVYRQGGVIGHTAIVRYVADDQPVLVEGKWGHLGVFVHPVDQSIYGTDYTLYRSLRVGHLLVGCGGRKPTGDAAQLPVRK